MSNAHSSLRDCHFCRFCHLECTAKWELYLITVPYHLPNEQVFELESMIKTLDPMGRVVGTPQHFQMPGRYLHRFELQHLLRLGGFEIVNLYGWFNRDPFNRTSKRMIWVATPSTD